MPKFLEVNIASTVVQEVATKIYLPNPVVDFHECNDRIPLTYVEKDFREGLEYGFFPTALRGRAVTNAEVDFLAAFFFLLLMQKSVQGLGHGCVAAWLGLPATGRGRLHSPLWCQRKRILRTFVARSPIEACDAAGAEAAAGPVRGSMKK